MVGEVGPRRAKSERAGVNKPYQAEAVVEAPLAIAEEYFHHHAETILAASGQLEADVRARFTHPFSVPVTGSDRIPAKGLNYELRRQIGSEGWYFEATVEDGVLHGKPSRQDRLKTEGFDFAVFDEQANLAALWDVCFGRRARSDGATFWEARALPVDLARLVKARLDAQPSYRFPKRVPTVLGEIQFGNHAHLGVDLMRLLSADQQIGIDLFIYVTKTGALSDALSGGTVTYESAYVGLHEFANLIRVPTWLIALDLPNDFWSRPQTPVESPVI